MDDAAVRLALLNDWQRGFPLVEEPFAAVAAACGTDAATALRAYREMQADGRIARIGGVFGAGAGGAAMLCAFAVPAARLDEVAAQVSAHPGVNHNYEREHDWNLWFVMTGRDHAAVAAGVDGLQAAAGCDALRLPMRRAYRIDLGFDLRGTLAPAPIDATTPAHAAAGAAPVDAADAPLAALVEVGLPLVERPYAAWAEALGAPQDVLFATLRRWLARGTLRRFGVVVRHHELGFAHNAMAVFDVPDDVADVHGARLAAQPGVTLAYRRERDCGWSYNLYCMVHGRDRGAVRGAVAEAAAHAGLSGRPQALLFSRRRFKQQGARYFRAPQQGEPAREVCDACV
jgi:DNA-binding Lrp family transcriptional regulator